MQHSEYSWWWQKGSQNVDKKNVFTFWSLLKHSVDIETYINDGHIANTDYHTTIVFVSIIRILVITLIYTSLR